MVFAAYLLKNAILVLSRVGHLHPIIKPHRGAFAAFPKQNDKCPTNARRGMCTLRIDWAIFLCPAFVRSSRVKQIRRSNSDRAAGVEKTRLNQAEYSMSICLSSAPAPLHALKICKDVFF